MNIEDAIQWWIHDSAFAFFGSGLFQVAFSLAVVVYPGRRLSLALQAAISAMVTACVQKQMDSCQSESMALPSSAPMFGQASSSQGAACPPWPMHHDRVILHTHLHVEQGTDRCMGSLRN